MESEDFNYVIAIDIGTSYSGYAFNDTTEHERDNLSITLNSWKHNPTMSLKVPTAVLFDKEKNFHSFGYAAEKTYAQALEQKKHEDFIFLKNFKMELHKEKEIARNLELQDKRGQKVLAMTVFEKVLGFLHETALKDITRKLGEIDHKSIRYVVTVPAIWREPAKQFMRISAEKAGIPQDQLILALEPEAAALYCRHLELNTALGKGDQIVKDCFKPGGKYMILDMGGGTVDTVVHKIDEKGDIVELFKSSGGPWGGDNVNKSFKSYIQETYGEEATGRFEDTRPRDSYDLETDFEIQKRQLTMDSTVDFRMRVPGHLKILSDKPIEKHTVDHLYITRDNVKSFFDPWVEKIIEHAYDISRKVGGIPLMFLVGGFSESSYVEERIREAFPQVKVIVPRESGLAVLKGAVLFGFNPQAVTMRICRFTYGIQVTDSFDASSHPKEKMIVIDGEKMCKDIFMILVHEGDKVEFNDLKEKELCSRHRDKERKHITVTIPTVASPNTNPKFTTDLGCQHLGTLKIKSPENGWPKDKNEYKLKCRFGRTEISLQVHDTTNDRQYAEDFDMLE